MKKLFLFLFVLFIVKSLFSQTKSVTDSLLVLVKENIINEDFPPNLMMICDSIQKLSDIENDQKGKVYASLYKAIIYIENKELKKAKIALDEVMESSNFEKNFFLLNTANAYLGYFYYLNSKNIHATNILKKSIDNCILSLDNKEIRPFVGFFYRFRALSFSQIGDFQRSLSDFNQSTVFFSKNDQYKSIFVNEKFVGRIFQLMSTTDTTYRTLALKKYNLAIQGFKEYADYPQLAWMYAILADIHIQQNHFNRALKYQDSCFFIANRIKNNDLLGLSFNNYGEIYLQQNKIKLAIIHFRKALEFYKNSVRSERKIACKLNLARAFISVNQLDSAEALLTNCFTLAKKENLKKQLYETSIVSSLLYEKKQEYKNALEYSKLSLNYNKDIFSKYNSQELEKYKQRSEYQELLRYSEVREMNLQREKWQKYSFASVGFLLLIVLFLSTKYLLKLTETKRIQERILGQETERERLAGDLHDSVTGNLAMEITQLENLESFSEGAIKEHIHKIRMISEEIRQISHDLRLPIFENSNLAMVASEFIHRFSGNYPILVDFAVYSEIDWNKISKKIQIELYRIIQEALRNVVKHAKAKEVIIQVTKSEKKMSLTIEDDGVGFNQVSHKGIGLQNIISRVEMLKGECEISSAPGEGTQILIDIPIV